MSQYGALGYAQHGWTYPQILAHYYPGTTLGRAPGVTIRVLLAERRRRSRSPRPRRSRSRTGPARRTARRGRVHLRRRARAAGGRRRSRAPQALTCPAAHLLARPGRRSTLGGKAYRGQLLVDSSTASSRRSTSSGSSSTCTASSRRRCRPPGRPTRSRRRRSPRARTRSRPASKRGDVRRLREIAQPGLRRDRSRARRDHRGGRRDEAPGASSTRARSRRRSSPRPRAAETAAIEDAWPESARCRTSSRCPTRTTRSRPTTTGARCRDGAKLTARRSSSPGRSST